MHEGLAEALKGLFKQLSTEIALACLLEHQEVFEYSRSYMELLQGLRLFILESLLDLGELAASDVLELKGLLLYTASLRLNLNELLGGIVSIFVCLCLSDQLLMAASFETLHGLIEIPPGVHGQPLPFPRVLVSRVGYLLKQFHLFLLIFLFVADFKDHTFRYDLNDTEFVPQFLKNFPRLGFPIIIHDEGLSGSSYGGV